MMSAFVNRIKKSPVSTMNGSHWNVIKKEEEEEEGTAREQLKEKSPFCTLDDDVTDVIAFYNILFIFKYSTRMNKHGWIIYIYVP